MTKASAPCGTWPSPITAARVAAGSKPLSSLRIDGARIHWLQGLPEEHGRVAAMVSTASASAPRLLTAAPLNVRSRVHEYGEGAYVVAAEALFFSNYDDNLVYGQGADGVARPITRDGAQRHADFELDVARRRLIAVCEDHRGGSREPRNLLVAIACDGHDGPVELASGHDFYAAPRLSPDGRRLAWLAWNHPSMPFFDTELWLAEVAADGTLVAPRRIAGGVGESLAQPQWSPDGQMVVVSDRSGWWNLYRVDGHDALDPLCPMAAEFAHPQWVFAQSMYGFNGANEIIATCIERESRLGRIDLATRRWTPMASTCTDIDELRVGAGFAAIIGGAPTVPRQVVRIDLPSGASTVLASSVDDMPDLAFLAPAEALEFPSTRGRTAHAFYYAPTNPHFVAAHGEQPPLIVTSHGGPTSSTNTSLRLNVAFWTSRGFALVDVNYGGSTGYGRAYRELLRHAWGVVDVEDCVAAARHLATLGLADPDRMTIRGASASGFTTLCALIFRSDVFKAGASWFGVSDLASLDADTHKFESRYTTWLVEKSDYASRSPLALADRLDSPVIFFQGRDDKVVTPAQSESMVAAMKRRGVPVEYHAFEGEGHGFRKAATIETCLEAELAFYGQVLGLRSRTPPPLLP